MKVIAYHTGGMLQKKEREHSGYGFLTSPEYKIYKVN